MVGKEIVIKAMAIQVGDLIEGKFVISVFIGYVTTEVRFRGGGLRVFTNSTSILVKRD